MYSTQLDRNLNKRKCQIFRVLKTRMLCSFPSSNYMCSVVLKCPRVVLFRQIPFLHITLCFNLLHRSDENKADFAHILHGPLPSRLLLWVFSWFSCTFCFFFHFFFLRSDIFLNFPVSSSLRCYFCFFVSRISHNSMKSRTRKLSSQHNCS